MEIVSRFEEKSSIWDLVNEHLRYEAMLIRGHPMAVTLHTETAISEFVVH